MMSNGKLLDGAAKESCEHFYILFRSALNHLAVKAEENKQLRYHLRPKLHHLEHLILDHCRKGPELSLYVMLFRRGHGAAHQKDGSETASAGLRPAYD